MFSVAVVGHLALEKSFSILKCYMVADIHALEVLRQDSGLLVALTKVLHAKLYQNPGVFWTSPFTKALLRLLLEGVYKNESGVPVSPFLPFRLLWATEWNISDDTRNALGLLVKILVNATKDPGSPVNGMESSESVLKKVYPTRYSDSSSTAIGTPPQAAPGTPPNFELQARTDSLNVFLKAWWYAESDRGALDGHVKDLFTLIFLHLLKDTAIHPFRLIPILFLTVMEQRQPGSASIVTWDSLRWILPINNLSVVANGISPLSQTVHVPNQLSISVSERKIAQEVLGTMVLAVQKLRGQELFEDEVDVCNLASSMILSWFSIFQDPEFCRGVMKIILMETIPEPASWSDEDFDAIFRSGKSILFMSVAVLMLIEDASLGTLRLLATTTIPRILRHVNALDSSWSIDNCYTEWQHERNTWQKMQSEWRAFQNRTLRECVRDLGATFWRHYKTTNSVLQHRSLSPDVTKDFNLMLKEVVIEVDPRYKSEPVADVDVSIGISGGSTSGKDTCLNFC
jgi:hypothetical protein